ncbi:MAG: DUF6434 domain-containing protein [Bacteroidota bacterium]|nr:DUF6434 domain-containing protein [Bacteroidota bacterium]
MAKLNTFDWHSEKLTTSTEITSSYKNTQDVRRFFKKEYWLTFLF